MRDENKLQFGHDEEPIQQEYEDTDEEVDDQDSGEETHQQDDSGSEGDSQSEHEAETNADENSEDERPKPKKRDKAQTRINQLQREKYRALHENEQLKAQLARIENEKEAVSQAGMRQYETNVASRLEKARAAQIAAIEAGDAQAQADANMELASATNEYHELNNWKRQYEYQKSSQQNMQPEPYVPTAAHNAEITQDWMDDNEWFNPNSEKYDQELSNYINYFSNNLDAELINAGHGDKVRDSTYFAWIDHARDEFIQRRNYERRGHNNQTQRRDLNMRVDRGRGPSPVRGGQGMYSPQRRGIADAGLSREEREMAGLLGVSDEAYKKQKDWDIKENPHKRGGF